MRTVKFLFVTVVLLLTCSTIQAQFNQRLNNAVKNAAENAAVRQAEKRTEQAVNKAIDDALDPNKNEGNNNKSGNTQPAGGNNNQPTGGNNNQPAGGGDQPAPAATPADAVKAAEMTYSKSDFVAGDVIFFDDNLANEKLGEFPSQWDLDQGNAEVASINGEKCINLIGYTILTPLISTSKNYLPDEFTIEYDVFADTKDGSVECELGFHEGRTFIGRHWINKDATNFSFNWIKPDDNHGNQNEEVKIRGNEWNHVSISFNKRALKYYINGVRILNVPNMKKPSSFWIWAREGKTYFKNIRVAKGAVPLYDRMMTDGKFITYGITFDIGKSSIKPESMGEINRIVTLMTENPDLKFSVEGHTDNTGNSATNQTLSEARSKAVVDKLVENGVARDRLTAAGKGQTTPIADNGSDEGRAKNRRVEFVKI